MSQHCGLWAVDALGTQERPERACGLAFNQSYLAHSQRVRLLHPAHEHTSQVLTPSRGHWGPVLLRLQSDRVYVEKKDSITTLSRKKVYVSHTVKAYISARTWGSVSKRLITQRPLARNAWPVKPLFSCGIMWCDECSSPAPCIMFFIGAFLFGSACLVR